MKKWLIIIVLSTLTLLTINTLYTAGVFKRISNHVEGDVVRIYAEMPGTEDLEVISDRGLLLISSADRWKTMKGLPANDGIYQLQLDSAKAPTRIQNTYQGEFHPHGISYLRKGDEEYLFVVNHNKDGNFIESFAFRRDTLFHIRSYSDEQMCCPNDVVATDTDKFYVTNDHGTRGGIMRTLEDYLLIPWSYILYFNGNTFSKVRAGLNYANGITVSNDRSKLYVACVTGRELLSFNIRNDGSLSLADRLNLRTGIDNIDVDEDGNLWIGAHPKLLAFVGHAGDSSRHSPSQVLKLTPNTSGSFSVEEIFLDDGTVISGSSTAVRYKNEVFVGVVFERKLLRMKLKPRIF